ncbi:MAG: ATP-binding protein, partial [Candidatus Sumerlaeota bacterium]|nr:ATP-binding protein [Candidatus Sumerlaeota bacterium]
IYDLGNKQWNIPKLRELLEDILPKKAAFDNYEVEHNFSTIGRRVMLLNARQIERGSGKERIILLAIEDITERKEIEAGLEKTRKELAVIKKSADESLEYAESIINTVREPLISLDQDLRVVTASRSFYEVFKVNHKETVGQLIYDLGNKQWDIPKLRELLETILPQKATFDNYEVEHDFSTIGKRIMLLNARQIQRGSGKERIILLAIEDITERKQVEKALHAAKQAVEAASRAKSEFLANMSHELRTPLNSIIGFSEVLHDQTFGPLTHKQTRYVDNVLTAGQHLLSLINDILDISKVEAGKMTVEARSFPVRPMLDNALVLVKERALKHGLMLSLETPADLTVSADERMLKQILFNLLSNAVKFSEPGGRVAITAERAGDDLCVSVADTGIGIKLEDQARLFTEFEQLDSGYDRMHQGTGLGLALTRKFVELHGGRIWVESEGEGKGSTFRFTLPLIYEDRKNPTDLGVTT